jgi:hypothetical protein
MPFALVAILVVLVALVALFATLIVGGTGRSSRASERNRTTVSGAASKVMASSFLDTFQSSYSIHRVARVAGGSVEGRPLGAHLPVAGAPALCANHGATTTRPMVELEYRKASPTIATSPLPSPVSDCLAHQ